MMTAAMLLAGLSAGQIALAQESAPASAASASSAASVPEIASGKQSRAWMELQAARQQASKTRQTISGPVMSKIHERYVKSFTQPIPESVRDTTPISGSASN